MEPDQYSLIGLVFSYFFSLLFGDNPTLPRKCTGLVMAAQAVPRDEILKAFEIHADVNARVDMFPFRGMTNLHIASALGLPKATAALTIIGASPNLTCNYYPNERAYYTMDYYSYMRQNHRVQATCLHLAAAALQENIAVIKLLLSSGADPAAKDLYGCTALHIAAARGHSNIIRLLVKAAGVSVQSHNISNNTPLHYAILNGHLEATSTLLELGAWVSSRDKYGSVALHFAVMADKNSEALVDLLIQADADVNVQSPTYYHDETPLMFAANWGRSEVVAKLLAAGADPSCTCSTGNNALHLAIADGHYQIAGMLLEAGVDVNGLETDFFMSPLHIAVTGDIGKGCSEMCLRLLAAGANIDAKTGKGHTPINSLLRYTQFYNSIEGMEVLHVLLSAGADVNSADNDGRTPLHTLVACCGLSQSGSEITEAFVSQITMIVDWMCDAGAESNLKTIFGLTPLNFLANFMACRLPEDSGKAFLSGIGAPLVVALIKGGNRDWVLVPVPCDGIGGALLPVWRTSSHEDLAEVFKRLEEPLKPVAQLMLKVLHRRLPSPNRAELRMSILFQALER